MKTEILNKKTTHSLISNFSTYISETEPGILFEMLNQLLKDCDFNILKFTEHDFDPEGYTCLWLLGESHLAVHTFPEQGVCYVELSSCNREKNELFKQKLANVFYIKD